MRRPPSPPSVPTPLIPALLLALLASSCISFSTFQSPRVLERGEAELGGGILFGVDLEGEESGLGELALLGRYGLADRVDVGAKLWGFPPFVGIYGDVRYQVAREPVLVAGALGASWFSFDEFSTGALYPTVMVGADRFFAGGRWTFLTATGNEMEETFGAKFPGIVVGASFGSRVILAPEVNVLLGDETAVMPGAALVVRF
jgi:hypothetical protein